MSSSSTFQNTPKGSPRDAQGALVFVITDDLGMIIITCSQVDEKSSVLQKTNAAAGRKTGPIFLGGSLINLEHQIKCYLWTPFLLPKLILFSKDGDCGVVNPALRNLL